tara:strand:+ start:194 stop:412 length:219 start_codon:yes stop_codon:yes gene_type:complete
MPYKTRKVRNKPCYKVYNPDTKKVFAKCTTKEQAQKQMRLLRGLQNNKDFAKRVRERGMSVRKTMKKTNIKK